MYHYTRSDVLRILRMTVRQFAGLEKDGLIAARDTYSFFDLLQIKKVRDLCARQVRPAVIRESLAAMQKAAGMDNPLLEAGAFTSGKRVAFRHEGKILEPIAGQFMFDFAPDEHLVSSAVVPIRKTQTPTPTRAKNVAELFAEGIALEEDPNTHVQAMITYEAVLALEPEHAAAHINLGTLYYNRQDFVQSEKHYRAAIAVDPRYALAHFDLGNVLDETGRIGQAIQCYQTALQLAPTYADAHYNIALAYEKISEPRRALKHWRAYVKLDAAGPWSTHARAQIKRILQMDRLKLVAGRKQG